MANLFDTVSKFSFFLLKIMTGYILCCLFLWGECCVLLLNPALSLAPGGYWYNCCTDSNLNGVYYRQGEHDKHLDGITWYGWHGASYSLKRVEMKIRPEDFKP